METIHGHVSRSPRIRSRIFGYWDFLSHWVSWVWYMQTACHTDHFDTLNFKIHAVVEKLVFRRLDVLVLSSFRSPSRASDVDCCLLPRWFEKVVHAHRMHALRACPGRDCFIRSVLRHHSVVSQRAVSWLRDLSAFAHVPSSHGIGWDCLFKLFFLQFYFGSR